MTTDPGVDDAWAILYLAAQPDIEIVAIGAAHGNVPTATAAAPVPRPRAGPARSRRRTSSCAWPYNARAN
ncbi:nucleoside hydrolase [Streptomyces sp. BRA346]